MDMHHIYIYLHIYIYITEYCKYTSVNMVVSIRNGHSKHLGFQALIFRVRKPRRC